MRASIIIASHNEGDLLRKTVRSCIQSTEDLDYEIVIADDDSQDDSVERLMSSLEEGQSRALEPDFPDVRLVSTGKRCGPSPTKDLGARNARGDVLIFLDGHTKPQSGAVRRLVEDIDELEGRAIVIPSIPALDPNTWEFQRDPVGYGFCMDLLTFECAWIRQERMARRGRYHECPASIGCCLAVSRDLYKNLLGFDRDMIEWGLEDIDFGLKAWLLGHDLLVDCATAIGHRFQEGFESYSVTEKHILANKLRMARKNFTEPVFQEWVEYTRSIEADGVWNRAWEMFEGGSESIERERDYLMARRVRDEFDYAERYGARWPRRVTFQSNS